MAPTFVPLEGKEEEPAFLIFYYDDNNLFPSLLPLLEARLPLDGVLIKNPYSPHAAVYCNTLRLKFVRRDSSSDAAVLPKAALGGSNSTSGSTGCSAAAVEARLAGGVLPGASTSGTSRSLAPHASPQACSAASSTAAFAIASAAGAFAGASSVLSGRQGRLAATATAPVAARTSKPFVYLQILHLENIENYKTQYRRVLRAWVDSLTEQHEEWLVLYVTPFSESEAQSRSFRKILDKLKSDLNPPGSRSRERFLRVPTDPTGQYSHAPVFHDLWHVFMLRLKEALAAAIEGRYAQLEEELQRQTQAPEPRFCAVFSAKEELALLHALCNRPAEALAVLDSLDLQRSSSGGGLYDFQTAPGDVPPWQSFFRTFGFSSQAAQVPVLLNQKRLARLQHAVREDTISYIEFRQYLFARQTELLLRLNRLEELGARAIQLISSLYKELINRNISVGGHTWALLAAVNLAGYLVAQSAVHAERTQGAPDTDVTPRSVADEGGSPWRPSRLHDFAASPASTTPSVSPYGSVSAHPLLPLKYPTLASAARTLHRLTPLQFSFSPTRRSHGSHRGRAPPPSSDSSSFPSSSSSSSSSSSVPPSAPAAAVSATEPLETGGVAEETSSAAKGGRAVNGGFGGVRDAAAGASAAVSAPAARYAGVLYGYAVQYLQRLIYWRETHHWCTPLKDIPSVDTEDSRLQPRSPSSNGSGATPPSNAGANAAAAGDRQCLASDETSFAGEKSGGGEELDSSDAGSQRGVVDDESYFSSADMEMLNGLLLIVSRRTLLEELQTVGAMEDMLARLFVLAGQQFMNGGYYRHAAVLQFRLAAANFRRDCLEECKTSLGRLLPLFLKEPWTELWLECQHLLCQTEHRLGDSEAELRSTYALSNVNAKYQSKRRRFPAALLGKKERKEKGAAALAAAPAPPPQAAADAAVADAAVGHEVVAAEAAGDTASVKAAAQRGLKGLYAAERWHTISLQPANFLQRFIALARAQQAENHAKPPPDAAAPVAHTQRYGEQVSSWVEVESMADAGTAQVFRSETVESAAENYHPAVAALAPEKRSVEARGEPGQVHHAGQALSCAQTYCYPGLFEAFCLAEERQLHLSSSPNLYCWAALKASMPADVVSQGSLPRGCLSPALALASITTQTAGLEPLAAPCLTNGMTIFHHGEGNLESTPCTLMPGTPRGGSTTTSMLFAGAGCIGGGGGGSSSSTDPTPLFLKCQMLSSALPGAPKGGASSYPGLLRSGLASAAATPGVFRGSRSPADVLGQEPPANIAGGGITRRERFGFLPRSLATYCSPFFGSLAKGGAGGGLFVRNGLRVRGTVDRELLEHAVLRQLADLLPLSQLPCHPELGCHAYFAAYLATLLRLKPKSVAQVLGQQQQQVRTRWPGTQLLPPSQPRSNKEQRQVLELKEGDPTQHSELSTLAAAPQQEDEEGDGKSVSRPRSAVRAASEGTQKRPRGSTSATLVEDPDTAVAESATPASSQPINRTSSGLSAGLREFRWRRSKTLTNVGQLAATADGETPAGGAKGGEPCSNRSGSFQQAETSEPEQRSSGRTGKGAGRVSLLLSRRRRSTTGTVSASHTATAAAAAAATPFACDTSSRKAEKVTTTTTTTTTTNEQPTAQDVSRAAEATAEGATREGWFNQRSAAAAGASATYTDASKGDNCGAHNDGGGSGGGGSRDRATGRLPEQFRTFGQQLPAAAAAAASLSERSTRAQAGRVDGEQLPLLPLLQSRQQPEGSLAAQGSDLRGSAAAAASPERQQYYFYGGGQTVAADSPANSNASAPLRSRALSVLEVSSAQNALPSLSVSLGQHIELQLYVHSCLAAPLPADYVALRLSQLPPYHHNPFAPAVAGGSMRAEPPLSPTAMCNGFQSMTGSSKKKFFAEQEKRARLLAADRVSVEEEEEEELFDLQRSGSEFPRTATSVWLVVRPEQRCMCGTAGWCQIAEGEQTEDDVRIEMEGEASSCKLVLKPGVNRLSLLWSSRTEGTFALEQICVGVGAAVLIQWAGDLPLPDMMDSVAQTMESVLRTASARRQLWHRRQKEWTPPSFLCDTMHPGANTGESINVETSRSPQLLSRSVATSQSSCAAAADTKALRTTVETEITRHSSGESSKRDGSVVESSLNCGGVAASTLHTSANGASSASTLPAAATTAKKEQAGGGANPELLETETQLSGLPPQGGRNVLFQPIDSGDLASAVAFEERTDPPAWLLQQLARGCSPLGATLLQPIAPLERMLRPLIFEVRSPSTAVHISVQPASPSDSFLFLEATNVFVVRIDAMPGLFMTRMPCRLRILQCLLPVALDEQQKAAEEGHLAGEIQMQDSFFLGEGGAEASTVDDHDLGSCYGSMCAGGRSDHIHGRMRRQPTQMCRGHSTQHDSGESPPMSAVPASPPLSTASPGTVGAATWRRFGRGGGSGSWYRSPPQSRLYGQPSLRVAGQAAQIGRWSLLPDAGGTTRMASAPCGETRERSNSVTYTEKDLLSSPWWTPAATHNRGFEAAGLQSDDQQLFEAAAVQLHFQWQQAVAQAVDGMPAYCKLGERVGQSSQHNTSKKAAAAAAAGAASLAADEDPQAASVHLPWELLQDRSRRSKKMDAHENDTEAQPTRTTESGSSDLLSPGLLYKKQQHLSPPSTPVEPIPRFEARGDEVNFSRGKTRPTRRQSFVRICADEEEGDVLALLPPCSGREGYCERPRRSFCGGEKSRVPHPLPPIASPCRPCWLELPPFHTSCEILVPVVPVLVGAPEGSSRERLYMQSAKEANAGCGGGVGDAAAATDGEVLLMHESRDFPPASSPLQGVQLRSSDNCVGDVDMEEPASVFRSAALRPHSGGMTRASMAKGENEDRRRPFSDGEEPAAVSKGKKKEERKMETARAAGQQRRSSSCGGEVASGLPLQAHAFQAMSSMRQQRTEWNLGKAQWSFMKQPSEELLLPSASSFRKRRSAFIVPPSAFSPPMLGAQNTLLLDTVQEAGYAHTSTGTGVERMTTDREKLFQSPAARAAQQISMAALLNQRQQQERLLQQEQHHRDLVQQQGFRPVGDGFRTPPLEYYVNIVTTVQFYMRTGIPAAASLYACPRGDAAEAHGSAAVEAPPRHGGEDLYVGPQNRLTEGQRWTGDPLLRNYKAGDKAALKRPHDLGLFIPLAYSGRSDAGRSILTGREFQAENSFPEEEASDLTASAFPRHPDSASGVPVVHPARDGAEGSGRERRKEPAACATSVRGGGLPGFAATAADVVSPRRGVGGAAPWASRCPSVGNGAARAAGGMDQRGRPQEKRSVDSYWKATEVEEEEKEEVAFDEDLAVEEELFDSVEVCPRETLWLRQQAQKELAAALLHQRGLKEEAEQHCTQHGQEAAAKCLLPAAAETRSHRFLEGGGTADAAAAAVGDKRKTGKKAEVYDGEQQLCAAAFTRQVNRLHCAQPVTVTLASTSRVHGLAVRVALQHSQRVLHASRDALLQQVLLSSCCSPAEPLIVESASIKRLPHNTWCDKQLYSSAKKKEETEDEEKKGRRDSAAGRDDHNKEKQQCGGASIKKKDRNSRRPLHSQRTKVSLIAPPPASLAQAADFSVSPAPQKGGSVRLDSLLFGERVMALLVHLEHRRSKSHRHYSSSRSTGNRERREKRKTKQGSAGRQARGRKGELLGDGSSDNSEAAEALLWGRVRAAFEPKLDTYVLSIRYRFLQRPQINHKSSQRGCAVAGGDARIAEAMALLVGPGSQKTYMCNSDEATTQDTETTVSEDEGTADELLEYKIPLVFPGQQFPFEAHFVAPRTGKVSVPLVVSLTFSNCSDLELEVRHTVSLEFDDESGSRSQATTKFFSSTPLLGSKPLFASRLRLHHPHLYWAASPLRLEGSVAGPRVLPSFWRGGEATRGGAAVASGDDAGKSSTSKKDFARSSRLGECHDWLMVGSKCKTTTLAARSAKQVRFRLVPLRAGCLPLPTVRVRIRSRSEAHREALAQNLLWQYAAEEAAVGGGSMFSSTVGPAVSTAADKRKLQLSPLFSHGSFWLDRQTMWDSHNEAAQQKTSISDWWLPVPYGESVTAGREVLVLPKVVSKPDARLLPD